MAASDPGAHLAAPVDATLIGDKPPGHAPSLSIVSLIFGILSLPMIFACFASLLTSLVAIVTGHLAVGTINRSMRPRRGKTAALVGLAFGYVALIMTIGLMIAVLRLDWSPPDQPRGSGSLAESPADRLRQAESEIIAHHGNTIGKGNTSAAARIATRFAEKLMHASELSFTGGRDRIFDLTDGEFLTYCELQDESCALLVHVPSYKDYQGDVREVLSALAWTIAVAETADNLDAGDRLAVAMRGTLLYGDILVGVHPGDADLEPAAKGDQEDLLAFFPSPQEASPQPFPQAEIQDHPIDTAPHVAGGSDSPQGLAGDLASSPRPAPSSRSTLAGSTAPQRPAARRPIGATPRASDSGAPLRPLTEPTPSSPTARVAESGPSLDRTSGSLAVRAGRPAYRPADNTAAEFLNRIPVQRVRSIDAKGWTIQCMVFLNEDRWLAAGRIDSTITIFDLNTGSPLSVSDRINDLGGVVAMDRSAGGQHLILGGQRGLTGVIPVDDQGQLGDFQPLFRHSHHASLVTCSPAFAFALSGGGDGTLAWQPFDGRASSPRISQELKRQAIAARLPSNGDLALATDGRTLLEFSLKSGRTIRSQQLSSRPAFAAAISPNGEFVTVSLGREMIEYDAKDGAESQRYRADRPGIQWHVAFHPTESWLLSGGRGSVTVWDRNSAGAIASLDSGTILYIKTTALGVDSNQVALVPSAAGQSIQIFRIGD